jgi:hypothetical protein
MQTLRGIAVSHGVAIGPVLVIDRRGQRLPHRAIAAEAVADKLERPDWDLESAHREAEQAEDGDSIRVADPGNDQLEQVGRRPFLGQVQEQPLWIGKQPLVAGIVGHIGLSRVLVTMIQKYVTLRNLMTMPFLHESTQVIEFKLFMGFSGCWHGK